MPGRHRAPKGPIAALLAAVILLGAVPLARAGTGGGMGWTLDDVYFQWSERHPKDQPANSVNDCAAIGGKCVLGVCTMGKVGQACGTDADCLARPGTSVNARPCGTITFERLNTHNCTTGIKVTVTDSTPAATPVGTCTAGRCSSGLISRLNTGCASNADCTCAPGEVAIEARSTTEPQGESFCLAPAGGNMFVGLVQLSALVDQKGILNVNATQGENFDILASYADPECDQDGDGQIGENDFRDVDGDGVPNFGADGIANDVSATDLLAEGQGSSDDDNCFDDVSLLDVYNPPGVPQRDNDGNGTLGSADCPAIGQPQGRSPRNGQCDWDDDGHGDLCDNCPLVANNDQLDTDGDGVGNACEVNDIDGDGVTNTIDNCPTLYNPSQLPIGAPRGQYCDAAGDSDGDGLIEAIDNCPNEAGGLEMVPSPPLSATYNPDQADNDADGIGDKCDSEDFDLDLVPNLVDNCPTIYNPADPTFRFQTDSDLDNIPGMSRYKGGDDRKGIDTLPGVQSYCDPDSTDDDLSGVPDDLLQVAAELSCEHSRSGDTNMATTPVSVGSLAISAVALADDGTADFICTSGDPDPLNNPVIPEPCPQETPGSPNNDAACDSPGNPGSGVCAAVPDGTADPGELASIRLTLVNQSVDKLGTGIPLNNLTVGIRPLTPSVGCAPRAQVFIGNMGAGASGVQTPAGALTFIVDPSNPGPGRSSVAKIAEAEFTLTAVADGIEGVPEQKFKFFVDLDRTDAPPIAAGQCPASPGAAGTLCEGFDTDRNGVAGIQFTRLPIGSTPGDPLRANGDPNDDIIGYTMDAGPTPAGTDGRICTDDVGAHVGCQAPVAEENDWHLHSPFEYPGPEYDTGNLGPGIGAPDGGKAHTGIRSLHMGRHLSATTTLMDTLRLRQVSAFVLDTQGDPVIPGVVPGANSTLEFWHMIAVPDDEDTCDIFVPCGLSFGGGQVQISLLGSNGKFERWQQLTPNFNGYDTTIQETISFCGFDPGDDQIPPNNETMCNFSPLFGEKGDIFGTDATCVTDTDHNDASHKDCGRISCAPGPNCTSIGSTGAGVWTRSAFSLSTFAGRVARLRWIGMIEGGWSFGTYRSALEPDPAQQAYQYFEDDDGWYIDDIRLTDLRQFPSIMGPDNLTGLSACTTGQATANCGAITVSIAGSAAFGSRRLLGLDALYQPVLLDARASVAGDDAGTVGITEGACANGVLQFQWERLDAGTSALEEVITPFSPQGQVQVAPGRDALYRVTVRCSSDLGCTAQQEVVVKVYTGDGSDLAPQTALNTAGVTSEIGLNVTAGTATSATLTWPARVQPPGISGYDLFRYIAAAGPGGGGGVPANMFSAGTFDGACAANAVPNVSLGISPVTTSLTGEPAIAAGQVFMYQVAHSSTNLSAIAPLGIAPAGSPAAGTLYMAGTTCP